MYALEEKKLCLFKTFIQIKVKLIIIGVCLFFSLALKYKSDVQTS